MFLQKFFPITRTNQIRKAITNFVMQDGKILYDTWEQFKELLCSCPHHQVPKWQLVQVFYEGLIPSICNTVDAIYVGTFLHKCADEAWKIFKTLRENSMHQAVSIHPEGYPLQPKREVKFESSHSIELQELSKKLD